MFKGLKSFGGAFWLLFPRRAASGLPQGNAEERKEEEKRGEERRREERKGKKKRGEERKGEERRWATISIL